MNLTSKIAGVLIERQQASSLLEFITKKEGLFFMHNTMMPTISSHIHLFRISNINQTEFRTCKKIKKALKKYIGEQCRTENTPNTTHHWQEW